jgi:hypothetical protein
MVARRANIFSPPRGSKPVKKIDLDSAKSEIFDLQFCIGDRPGGPMKEDF